MTTNQSIQRSLPIVATTLCNRFGVNIQLQGNEAKTDGKTIVLPSLLETKLNPTVLYGFLLHESGHVRLSTFGCRSQYPELSELHHAILNILEDGRIEREMSTLYAGGMHWIKTMDTYTVGEADAIGNDQNFRRPNKKPLEIFINYLFFWTRINFVGLKTLYDAGFTFTEKELIQTFGIGLHTELLKLLDASLSAGSTKELSLFADRILSLLMNHHKGSDKQAKNQEKKKQRQKKDGGESIPMQATASDGSQQEQESDGSMSTATAPTTADANVDAAKSVINANSVEIGNVMKGADSAQSVANALNREAQEVSEQLGSRILLDVPALMAGLTQPVRSSDVSSNVFEINSLIHESKTIAMRLERSLRTKIEAMKRTGVYHTHSGNYLNSRRLASFVTGNTKVFDRKIDKREVNTAIDVMLDMSGSMRRKGVHLAAKKAAMAFTLATHRIPGVDVGVSTFSEVLYAERPKVQSHIEHNGPLNQKVLETLAAYIPSGGTPCAEALLASVFRLSKCQRSTRHILFFITDGDINEAIPIIKQIQASKIETRALFITDDQLPHVFDHEKRISADADTTLITKSILELMSESVLS